MKWDGDRRIVLLMSQSNAVAERNLRSVLEGIRVNLEQAGLHHSYWSYAARHWCMAHNIQDHPKSNHPGNFDLGKSLKGPTFLLGRALTIGLDLS